MKIIYIVHQFYPMHYTGTEKVILNMSMMMQKLGNQVKVITYSFYDDSFYDKSIGNILLKEFSYKGIPILALKHKKIPDDINVNLENDQLSIIAEEIIRQENPDIIHVGHLMRTYELIRAAKMLKIPYIITLTDFWLICPKIILVNSIGNLCGGPEGGNVCENDCSELGKKFNMHRLKIAEEILINSKAVIAPSKFLASIFMDEFLNMDIKVINHGLKHNKLNKNNKVYKKEDKIIFCYAGSLNYHKGVHIVIEAFKKIKGNNAALKIYGSGDSEYTDKLKNAACDNRIEFCGVYSEDQVAEIFSNTDVIVVSSLWYETYSLILHEALASNIPVIASNVGVMKEKIVDNFNGLTFRIGDAEHLEELFQNLVCNPEIINSWKDNIKNIYIPSIEQEAYEYKKLYNQNFLGN